MTRLLHKIYRVSTMFGFDPIAGLGIMKVPHVLLQRREFLRLGGRITDNWLFPADAMARSAQIDAHYFYQDLYVARKVFSSRPKRHVDVGSRVDGFIAHLAVFRDVDVLDLRDVPPIEDAHINFQQRDILDESWIDRVESISCLHTIEHVGLGRYGDAIDPEGHVKAFRALVDRCHTGGSLYVSFPVGRPQVVFNAHRVIDPLEVIDWVSRDQLELLDFAYVDDERRFHTKAAPIDAVGLDYGCGIYTFRKR